MGKILCAICGKPTIYTMKNVPVCFKCINKLNKMPNNIEMYNIIKKVCEVAKIHVAAIQWKTKIHKVVEARQLCHYFAQKEYLWTPAEIAKEIGNVSRSDVYHSVKAINNYIDTDPGFRKQFKTLFDYYK